MPLEKSVTGSQAVTWSGLVPAHAEAFQKLCKELGWFVLFRGVNPDATPLIQDNYPTKDMGVHGKSSNWGPQAGFICLNQFFSKVVERGQDKVRDANAESPLSLDHGYPAVPLLVSEASLQELVRRKKIQGYDLKTRQAVAEIPKQGRSHTFQLLPVDNTSLERVAADMAALAFTLPQSNQRVVNPLRTTEELREYLDNVVGTISSLKSPSGKKGDLSHLFFVKTDPDPSGYPVWYAGAHDEVLFVLASTGKGRFSRKVALHGGGGSGSSPAQDAPFSLPLTADYDIFAICPPLAHLAGTPAERPLNWDSLDKGEKARHRWSLLKQPAREIRKLQLTDEWGAVTRYHLYGLLRLNMAAQQAGYGGGFVCHHGTEQENLYYAEVDEVYTVFSPSGQVYAVPPKELEFFLADIGLLGHVFYTNPSYVRVDNAFRDPESFGKRPAGRDTFEKTKVQSHDLHGKLVSKTVDAIVFHSRHLPHAFEHLEKKDKVQLLLNRLYMEKPVDPTRPGPLGNFEALVGEWTRLIAEPDGHPKQVKKVGIHNPPLPMSEVHKINDFVKTNDFIRWVKADPRRITSLKALLDWSA